MSAARHHGTLEYAGFTARVRGYIYDHVFSFPEREVGGVLIGRRDPAVVTGVIRALAAPGDLTRLTFSHDVWERIHFLKDRDFGEDDEIVGWYHSHPGHGVFLSDHDLFIHQHFFGHPSNVAYVVDPQLGEEALYTWAGPSNLHEAYLGPTGRAPVGLLHGTASRAARSPRLTLDDRAEAARHRPSPRARVERYPAVGLALPGIMGICFGLLLALLLFGGAAPAAPAPASLPAAPAASAAPAPEPAPADRDHGARPDAGGSARHRRDTHSVDPVTGLSEDDLDDTCNPARGVYSGCDPEEVNQ